ncbi:MAG: protein of unknown function DUF5447 [Inoviridae sp.]|nr:MAG: protein of unknown function DUF5447 [Inoviridae sp.]
MHAVGCTCSVCWAHNYCDALALFPLTGEELSQPFIDYYTFYDCTADFKREHSTSYAVERSSS